MLVLLKKYNTNLILSSVVLAIILGSYTPHLFNKISFLGDIFINLLKLFALPLICSALISTLGNMTHGLQDLKSLVRNMISYMLISEIIAVTIALLLFNFFKPGFGVNKDLILQGQSYISHGQIANLDIANFMLSIIPSNVFLSLTKFDLLPVVIFSIMFGIGCAAIGNEINLPVVKLFAAIRDVTNVCLHGVMLFAPIGIFVLIGNGVAESSLNGELANNFFALISFVAVLFAGLILHGLWQFLLMVILTKQSPFSILKQSLPVFSTAFASSSSVATLPVAMNSADLIQADPKVTRFMLPICAAVNIGGMMMYEVAAALFFSQVLGIHLSLGYQILIAIACILGGMAEGGIPETSLISLIVVFKIVNIPLTAISILLPLDRIIDRFRTMINIFGNMCGVVIVSKIMR